MEKIRLFLLCVICCVIAACDLQPKIIALPDTVGEFISSRYPALLADPEMQPEIYNSAVTDYGVYASPDLYNAPMTSDYVTYASVDDYIVPPQESETEPLDDDVQSDTETDTSPDDVTDDIISVPEYSRKIQKSEIIVAAGDTLYALGKKHNMSVQKLAELNNLSAPYNLAIGQKLTVISDVPGAGPETQKIVPSVTKPVYGTVPNTQTRVALRDITVQSGDTLYSLSRRYSVPVNDLAVMNKISAPFTLSVGQTLKVPDLESAPVALATPTKVAQTYGTEPTESAKKTTDLISTDKKAPLTKPVSVAADTKKPVQTTQKISSDPGQKLPKIAPRTSSKFAWPVRGKILSHYGAKSGGLFNDGINIGADAGTLVLAAENGVVAYAGNELKGMGNLVIIQHSGGWMTVYAHMDSMNVRRGTRVTVGQKIGTVGTTGKVDLPQLHFEIRKGTKAYNPSSYLKG